MKAVAIAKEKMHDEDERGEGTEEESVGAQGLGGRGCVHGKRIRVDEGFVQ